MIDARKLMLKAVDHNFKIVSTDQLVDDYLLKNKLELCFQNDFIFMEWVRIQEKKQDLNESKV